MRTLILLSIIAVAPGLALAKPVVVVGQKASTFTLTSVDGQTHRLADSVGKIVVLEWFNPDCPFVKRAYNEGPMRALQKAHLAAGGVWLTINSNAVGQQGNGQARNATAAKAWGLGHPLLLDLAGAVGREYGATRTPEMVVIDRGGVVIYRGGLDNTGGGGYAKPSEVVPHLANALTAARANKPVPVSETRPWGCSVKYGAAQ